MPKFSYLCSVFYLPSNELLHSESMFINKIFMYVRSALSVQTKTRYPVQRLLKELNNVKRKVMSADINVKSSLQLRTGVGRQYNVRSRKKRSPRCERSSLSNSI